jgi:hypothetical protein
MGHQDPTLSKQILDVAEAQREPNIEPDRVLDDFRRQPEDIQFNFNFNFNFNWLGREDSNLRMAESKSVPV